MSGDEAQQDRSSGFTPRPEAAGMKWGELLSPTKRAVAELLNRLRGAVEVAALERHDLNHYDTAGASHDHMSAKVPKQIDSTLLVKGERGTGKTTVLLCARDATERSEEFFEGAAAHEQAVVDANAISEKIIWLDPLDMEPMSATANPLTTLLVSSFPFNSKALYAMLAAWSAVLSTDFVTRR